MTCWCSIRQWNDFIPEELFGGRTHETIGTMFGAWADNSNIAFTKSFGPFSMLCIYWIWEVQTNMFQRLAQQVALFLPSCSLMKFSLTTNINMEDANTVSFLKDFKDMASVPTCQMQIFASPIAVLVHWADDDVIQPQQSGVSAICGYPKQQNTPSPRV